MRRGDINLYLDDLVTARAFARGRRHAFLAQAQLLPALGSRGNLELGAAVNGRHLNLCAQSGLRGRHRHGDVDIVALAAKDWMLAYANDDEEITRAATVDAGVALARDAYALDITRARL